MILFVQEATKIPSGVKTSFSRNVLGGTTVSVAPESAHNSSLRFAN